MTWHRPLAAICIVGCLAVSGYSVASATWFGECARDLAKERGAKYWVMLDSERGSGLDVFGFTDRTDVDPQTFFDLDLPLATKLRFQSVAAWDDLKNASQTDPTKTGLGMDVQRALVAFRRAHGAWPKSPIEAIDAFVVEPDFSGSGLDFTMMIGGGNTLDSVPLGFSLLDAAQGHLSTSEGAVRLRERTDQAAPFRAGATVFVDPISQPNKGAWLAIVEMGPMFGGGFTVVQVDEPSRAIPAAEFPAMLAEENRRRVAASETPIPELSSVTDLLKKAG
ncbi:MAG: hypothetical protein SGJ11_11345 [Phycisphaerae bacterium]|nr:hypothetical protein [Phycisphaerae bacterium]